MTDNKSNENQVWKKWFYFFLQGSIAGLVTILLAIVILQSLTIGAEMVLENLLTDVIIALVIGLPSGGIGGLLIGGIWNYRRASIVGGIIFALIMLVAGIVFAPFFLFGGY